MARIRYIRISIFQFSAQGAGYCTCSRDSPSSAAQMPTSKTEQERRPVMNRGPPICLSTLSSTLVMRPLSVDAKTYTLVRSLFMASA
ncbi:uncharacterized protein EI90DRAFT_3029156 [Cantharellus anzutake]|uniref:uncharacterized protein n=1 Tax=Cantharellus anzutake TaxID=1750568 RepID=UPI0019082523|nr:uncharacterized protein EI90DRAFT_3029156 [Cantharellus anzutake]KAF8344303.1 hypothetical protein EI90DRAFT_3029156 [Cantharellus anzutake]